MSVQNEVRTTKTDLKLPFMPINEEVEQENCIFGEEIMLNRTKKREDRKFKLTTFKKTAPTFITLGKAPIVGLTSGKVENYTPKTDATLDPESCKRLNAAKKSMKKVNLTAGFKIKKKSRKKKVKKVKILEPEDLSDEHILQNNLKNLEVEKPEIVAPQPEVEEKVEEKEIEPDLELKKFYSLKFDQKMDLIRNLDKGIVRHFFEKDYEGKIFASFERKLKKDPEFLRKFKLPLYMNLKGKVEYMEGYSYHDLLSLKEFCNACRDCEVNSLDATKDKRRKITKKIWSRLRHVYFLNRPVPDQNLRFNGGGVTQPSNERVMSQGYQFNGRQYEYF